MQGAIRIGSELEAIMSENKMLTQEIKSNS